MAQAASPTDHGRTLLRPGLLPRLREALANYRLYRSTLAELDALNDRELVDLGLSRFSIRDVAWESVYGT